MNQETNEKRTLTLVNVVHPNTLYSKTRMPALSLAYLAAYVPQNWKVQIVDETVEKFDATKFVGNTDIIALSGGNVCNIESIVKYVSDIDAIGQITGNETSVVVGGYVAGALPEFFEGKVDSLAIGPGESTLPKMLKDFENGKLKQKYVGKRTPLDKLKKPDFSGFNLEAYGNNINWPVMTSVSCDRTCDFCSARGVYGQGYEAASVSKVLEIIADAPKGKRIYFADPNIVTFTPEGIERAKELFKGMAKMDTHPWYGAISFSVTNHDDLLSLMKDSGCYGLLIGFDSVSPKTVQKMAGGKYEEINPEKLLEKFIKGVRKIQDNYGIEVLGTFVTGYDTDDVTTFDNMIHLIKESNMKDAQCMPLTPLPGTPLFKQFADANRIFDYNFAHYDFSEVVFKPNHLSPGELRAQMARVYDECFPAMARLYRRIGVVRDRPEEVRIKSVQQEILENRKKAEEAEKRLKKEQDEARRRAAQREVDRGGHH